MVAALEPPSRPACESKDRPGPPKPNRDSQPTLERPGSATRLCPLPLSTKPPAVVESDGGPGPVAIPAAAAAAAAAPSLLPLADVVPIGEVSGSDDVDDGLPADEKAIMRERPLLSDRCVRRGSIRLNRVSGAASAPAPPPVLPEADAEADAEPEVDDTMLLVSNVRFWCGSMRLRGLAAEFPKLGEIIADCGL